MYVKQDRVNAATPVAFVRGPEIAQPLLEEIASVFQRCFEGPPWNEVWTAAQAQQHLYSEYVIHEGIFVFQRSGSSITGFACGAGAESCSTKLQATVSPPIATQYLGSDVFYLGEVCVLPEARASKLGIKLFNELISQAQAAGYIYGLGVTRPDRKSALALAAAAGLRPVSEGAVTLGNATNQAQIFWGKFSRPNDLCGSAASKATPPTA